MLLLCALIVGSGSVWGDTYVLYSGTITEGDYIIYYNGKAIKNTINSNRLTYEEVTPSDGKITTSEASIIWHISQSGDYWTIYNTSVSKYAASTGSNNQAKLEASVTDNSKWTITGTETYDFENKARAAVPVDNRWLRNNGTYGFACYTSSTGGALSLYKKQESGKSPAGLSYATSKYATTFGASFDTPTLTNPNSLAVTYSTSDATIADVNSSTGAVTIKSKAGNATITASTEGDETHDAGNASYKIYVYEHSGTTSASAFTVAEANDFITNTLYVAGNYFVAGIVSQTNSTISSGKNTYYISDDGSKTSQLQVFQGKDLDNANFTTSTLVKLGEEVVVYGPLTLYNTKPEIDTGNYLYSITRKTDANLSVHSNASLEVTEEISDVYTTDSDGDVTITSSNPEIAAMEGNKLVAYKAGTTKITVNVASNATYAGAEKSFNVTVSVEDPVAPQGLSDVGFQKVTTEGEVASGDYLIVSEAGNVAFNGSLETLDVASNNISVKITSNKIPALESLKAATFTYDATAKTLRSKSGKYIGRSEYSNGLEGAASATLTNSISIDASGNVIITALESEGSNTDAGKFTTLRYNSSSGDTRFRYYKSGQKDIQLYKLSSAASYDISIGAAGWRTIVPAASASLPSGLKAYIVTGDVDGGKATLTEVASIKAGEAYVLNGDEGDYTLTVIDSPAEPTGNKLRVSTESDGNGAYVLANKLHGVGFYLWNGGSLGAGRVILPADAVTSAREFIAFDNETTGIKNLTPALSQSEGAWYDLQGRKVAQPTKGLYIVNGQKVVLK